MREGEVNKLRASPCASLISSLKQSGRPTFFMLINCPYLSSDVELSPEREKHIAESHPDLLPGYRDQLVETLIDPEQVRLSARFMKARLFTRWFDSVRGGKYIVVVVISEGKPMNRHWIITAYMARKLAGGDIEWKKN